MVGTAATIWVAVGVPMIVATVVPKRTETVPTLKLFPNSVTFVPAGPNFGLNWLGDAAKVGAGGGRTVNVSTLVANPPSVWTVIVTAPAAIVGTLAMICASVGVPTIVATVAPKRTETVPMLKLFPNSVTLTPAAPNLGLNWLGDGTKLGTSSICSMKARRVATSARAEIVWRISVIIVAVICALFLGRTIRAKV